MTHSELVDKEIDTQVVDQFLVEPPDLMRIYTFQLFGMHETPAFRNLRLPPAF